jgi:hypothetical protein
MVIFPSGKPVHVQNRSRQRLMSRAKGFSFLHPVDLGAVALQFISSTHGEACAEPYAAALGP